MPKRPVTLEDLDLPVGKKTRLYHLLHKYGPGHGRMMVLPIDQGLEHGPRDFFVNPESINPEFELRLALEGGFSAIAFQIGLAEKYQRAFAGKVPLIGGKPVGEELRFELTDTDKSFLKQAGIRFEEE